MPRIIDPNTRNATKTYITHTTTTVANERIETEREREREREKSEHTGKQCIQLYRCTYHEAPLHSNLFNSFIVSLGAGLTPY